MINNDSFNYGTQSNIDLSDMNEIRTLRERVKQDTNNVGTNLLTELRFVNGDLVPTNRGVAFHNVTREELQADLDTAEVILPMKN